MNKSNGNTLAAFVILMSGFAIIFCGVVYGQSRHVPEAVAIDDPVLAEIRGHNLVRWLKHMDEALTANGERRRVSLDWDLPGGHMLEFVWHGDGGSNGRTNYIEISMFITHEDEATDETEAVIDCETRE